MGERSDMKIRVLSDLHLEFSPWSPPPVDCDMVVLAGDIGKGVEGVKWAQAALDRRVVYVAGNHEFYRRPEGMERCIGALRDAAGGSSVRFLERDVAVIEGVRFLGCTLWTDFRLYGAPEKSMRQAEQGLNDFRGAIVTCDGADPDAARAFSPRRSVEIHGASVQWLDEALGKPFAGTTVVVTHHAPSARSGHRRYAGDPLNPCFASDLEWLIGKHAPAVWIHGHMHNFSDYRVGTTRVLCNPRGYSDTPENADAPFRPEFTIDLP
jgi:predicted phosphodiesterase